MKKLYLLLIGLILTSCSSFDTYTYDELEIFEENIKVTFNGTNIPFRVQGLGLERMGEGWAWPALGNKFFEELTEEYRNNDYELEILENNILKFESSIFSSYDIYGDSYRFNGHFNDEPWVWEKIDLSSERKDNYIIYSLPYLEDYEGYYIEISLTFPLDEESAVGYNIGTMVVFK